MDTLRHILRVWWSEADRWDRAVAVMWPVFSLIYDPVIRIFSGSWRNYNILPSVAIALLPPLALMVWRLGKATKPRLILQLDDPIFVGHQTEMVNQQIQTITYKLFRILVKNPGTRTIDGVRVFLESFSPNTGTIGRQALRFFTDHSPNCHDSLNGYRLDPGGRNYVGVFIKFTTGPHSSEIIIDYANKNLPNSIPIADEYEVALSAEGRDTYPFRQSYRYSYRRIGENIKVTSL